MAKRRENIRFITFFILLLYIVHYAGSSMFLHTHTIDGKPVVHSHLYAAKDANGVPVHQHSSASIELIHAFNNTSYISSDVITVAEYIATEVDCISTVYNIHNTDSRGNYYPSRAPPFYL